MLARSAEVRDEVLVARHRVGDERAFDAITMRHRRALVRHAERVLGVHRASADDVVQEALLRAHRAMLRDDRPIALAPWLHRLVRNCALDELARLRSGAVSLDALEPGTEPAAPNSDPGLIFNRRARLRRLLGDIAELPSQQRHALLRREVDGISHEELARELGTTVGATRGLVFRARTNLAKVHEASEASCEFVRADLARAHDERRRASAHTYRHLGACSACTAFRDGLADERRAMRLLSPAPLLLGLLGGAIGIKSGALGGGGAGAGATASAAGAKAAAVVAASAAVAGGVAGVQVLGPGDPVPVPLSSAALAPGGLPGGASLPAGTALVSRRADRPGAVELECPAGMRVAGIVPPATPTASMGLDPATVPGRDGAARVRVGGPADVRLLCKAPDASGSVLFGARPGGGRVCATHAYRHDRPGGAVLGSVRAGQPVKALARSGGWTRVRTDAGSRGWVRTAALC